MRQFGSRILKLRSHAYPSVSRCHLRGLHTPKPLKHRIEEGLGEFLAPTAYRTVAVDYQKGLLERLNAEVRGVGFGTVLVLLY